ncbi:unnamed protein product [Arabidopsis thaliana]|nr:unnamed protein product [Arabidopsis thaliana]
MAIKFGSKSLGILHFCVSFSCWIHAPRLLIVSLVYTVETVLPLEEVNPSAQEAKPQINGLPFNKYTWLMTHNAFSNANAPLLPGVERITFYNQEDTITNQLQNGVRGLMLDMYDFNNDIWLCHSLRGQCFNFTAFQPAINILREVEAFLSQNPTEIVTIIIEDYVHRPKGLSTLFANAGLDKYWFPVSKMPRKGEDWPTVTDMVQENHRLLVFTSVAAKEDEEGVAYQWRYMVENECINLLTRAKVTYGYEIRSYKPKLSKTGTRILVLDVAARSSLWFMQKCYCTDKNSKHGFNGWKQLRWKLLRFSSVLKIFSFCGPTKQHCCLLLLIASVADISTMTQPIKPRGEILRLENLDHFFRTNERA